MKNYHKTDVTAENNLESAPKTPQEISQMPSTIQMSTLGTATPPNTLQPPAASTPDMIMHPLSPLAGNFRIVDDVKQHQQLN
jgi:hypothetical protein